MLDSLTKKNYYFTDFTEDVYTTILKKTLSKYSFILFDQISYTENNQCLWRHDVDFSLSRALSLAKIEADLSIKSTYFILISGSFYNPLEKKMTDIIKSILDMGHDIGVHLDCDYYNITSYTELEEKLLLEQKIFKSYFQHQPRAFSFHNPNAHSLSFNKDIICDMVNTYSSTIKKCFKYCSDSNGIWRHDRLIDFVESVVGNIQVLTHPGWWQNEVLSPQQRVYRCVSGRANDVMVSYSEALKEIRREDIG